MDMMEDIFNFDIQSLQETKVESASKISQSIPETPANLMIVTKDQIEKRGYRNLLDLLNDLAGFNTTRFANAGLFSAVGVRGITGQNYFKILRDGIEIDMTQSEAVSVGMNYPLFGVERVEILIGGASVVYGADAVSGVINLITDLEVGLSSKISYGVDDYMYGDLRYSTKVNDNTFVFGVHAHRDQDYRLDELYSELYPKEDITLNGEIIQSAENRDFNFRPVYTRSAYFLLNSENWSFGGNYSETEDSTYISLTGDLTKNELMEKDSNMINELRGIYFKHRLDLGDFGKISSTVSYDATELSPESYYINKYSNYNRAYKYFLSERIAVDEIWTKELDIHELLIGLSFEHFYSMPKSFDLQRPFLDETATYPNSDISVDYFKMSWQNFALFFQDQIKFNQEWTLSLAGRFNQNGEYEDSFSPRVALIYKQTPKTTHKIILSKSFLAPSVHIRYSHYGYIFAENDGSRDWDTNQYQISSARVPNSDLEPEQSRNLEYNLFSQINNNLLLSLSLYKIDMKNVIKDRTIYNVTDILENTTFLKAKQQYNNTEALMYGGEISLIYRERFENFDIDSWFNYSYIDGHESIDGERSELAFIKSNVINLGGTFLINNFNITPSFKWVDSINSAVNQSDDSSKKIKESGYIVSDLFLKWRYNEHLDLMTNIYNIFDKRYFDVRKSGSSIYQTPQTGREIIFSLKYSF
jgi:outer membrane receptor for ferrienterochelin and colicins